VVYRYACPIHTHLATGLDSIYLTLVFMLGGRSPMRDNILCT
jgi:hypothetical protein